MGCPSVAYDKLQATVNIAGIVPGWLIGYLVAEDDTSCDYRILSVVSLIAGGDGIEPVVMSPDGRTLRASEVGVAAFAAGPGDDVQKIAEAHAAGRGRVVRSAAA